MILIVYQSDCIHSLDPEVLVGIIEIEMNVFLFDEQSIII